MPLYDYECPECGHIEEIHHAMREMPRVRCSVCRADMEKCININIGFIPPKDSGWESENNGKGRFIGGLGTRQDRNSYCRSLNEAEEKAKKRDLNYEIG